MTLTTYKFNPDREWDYSGRKGRDAEKKKIGKENEKKREK